MTDDERRDLDEALKEIHADYALIYMNHNRILRKAGTKREDHYEDIMELRRTMHETMLDLFYLEGKLG